MTVTVWAVIIWAGCIAVGWGIWTVAVEDARCSGVPPMSHDDTVSLRNYREGEAARVTLLRADSEYLRTRWERHGWPPAKAEAEMRGRNIKPNAA